MAESKKDEKSIYRQTRDDRREAPAQVCDERTQEKFLSLQQYGCLWILYE